MPPNTPRRWSICWRREPELAVRVAAAIHVGGRRWNLRVDGAIDVLLPESDPAGAWAQLARLERSNGLLKRDVQIGRSALPGSV